MWVLPRNNIGQHLVNTCWLNFHDIFFRSKGSFLRLQSTVDDRFPKNATSNPSEKNFVISKYLFKIFVHMLKISDFPEKTKILFSKKIDCLQKYLRYLHFVCQNSFSRIFGGFCTFSDSFWTSTSDLIEIGSCPPPKPPI